MFWDIKIRRQQDNPVYWAHHYCSACDVRWIGNAKGECWSCGSTRESRNLTASGESTSVGKHGYINPHGAMYAPASRVVP